MTADSQVSTLCIRSLPQDIARRELHALVGLFDGYEYCVLNQSAVGFVKFSSQESMLSAQQRLHGFVLDESQPTKGLQAEVAKRNISSRDQQGPRASSLSSGKRPSMDTPRSMAALSSYVPASAGMIMSMPHEWTMPYGAATAPPQQLSMPPYGYGVPQPDAFVESDSRQRPSKMPRPNPGASSDTICIRNIPTGTEKHTIESIVSGLPGFESCSFVSKDRANQANMVAFALFGDDMAARGAVHALQGTTLPSYGGEQAALLIEVARRSTRREG